MSTYAIGDIQGCYDEFMALLDLIQFNPRKDVLWLTGDLVNRGPGSLQTLRLIKNLGNRQITTLGNHDFFLLAVAEGYKKLGKEDTLRQILDAPDCNELVTWLRHQKLLHHDKKLNFVMTHAGILPAWDLKTAKRCAKEVEKVLHSNKYKHLLKYAFRDEPSKWRESLSGIARHRFIINAFARMRFCDQNSRLDFLYKGLIGSQPDNLQPWFKIPSRKPITPNIVFGHWAALCGITNTPHIFATDTGCIWGYYLTALRLEDLKRFKVKKFNKK